MDIKSHGGNLKDGNAYWNYLLDGTIEKYKYQDRIYTRDVETDTLANELSGVVSQWYFILRNLALLVLMLILIYSGIRIVIGSTAGEKAKYKERLMDWLVAMCLLFIMHYIMVFAVKTVGSITKLNLHRL